METVVKSFYSILFLSFFSRCFFECGSFWISSAGLQCPEKPPKRRTSLVAPDCRLYAFWRHSPTCEVGQVWDVGRHGRKRRVLLMRQDRAVATTLSLEEREPEYLELRGLSHEPAQYVTTRSTVLLTFCTV